MLIETRKSPRAQVYQPDAHDVQWTGGVWKERTETCARVTVPHIRALFEDNAEIFHVVENFRIASGEHKGKHQGTPFGDGDFYKWMEAAVYTAVRTNNRELLAQLEDYIALIGRAQQPEDIAWGALFLSSDLAREITGQVLHVDGGCCMV